MQIRPKEQARWVAIVVLLLASCSETGVPADGSSSSSLAETERTPVDPTSTGGVVLRVGIEGTIPERRELDLDREGECLHDTPIYSEFVVANPEGGLANVLVHVVGGHEAWLPPSPAAASVRLRQSGCVYRPHALALQLGQSLKVSNEDNLLHNVHVLPKRNPTSNLVQNAGSRELTFEFRRPELSIPVQCDIHPWMGAWVHVLDHPWFGISDSLGEARIENLPPGQYQLEVLHEKYGRKTVNCRVETGILTELSVSFES